MYRKQEFEDTLRNARPEIELGPDFNRQVMSRISRSKEMSGQNDQPYWYQIRIAGASLVLAGVMLFFLNATPLGDNVTVLASSVRTATVNMEKIHFKEPLFGRVINDILEKRDR